VSVFILRSLVEGLTAYYDKLLAFASLAGLLVSLVYLGNMLGNIQDMQRNFDNVIERQRPQHPELAILDEKPLKKMAEMLDSPVTTGEWVRDMFVPETRVWCVDCKRPIPINAKQCPFCLKDQPLDANERYDRDLDHDGMWDGWEVEHGLDPSNPRDAFEDPDGDGFTNAEEFNIEESARTDPKDPNSFPPIEAKLKVMEIKADQFDLKFKGAVKLPDGSVKFQINLKRGEKTYFVRLNEDVRGFKVVKYTNIVVEVQDSSVGRRKEDRSEIVLQRGDKQVPLRLGEEKPWSELVAKLEFSVDRSEYIVKADSVITLKGNEYRVLKIDTDNQSVVLERKSDRQQFTISRKASEPVVSQGGDLGP